MDEETQFWGLVERVFPSSTRLLRLRRKDPEAGDVEYYYPVFTSRERAGAFAREAGYPRAYDVAIGSQGEKLRTESPALQQMIEDIRPLERSEIPSYHQVLHDPVYGQGGPDFVAWADLWAEGE